MIAFDDFAGLKAASQTAPVCSKEELIALSSTVKSGDEEALEQLSLVLLPKFCSEYRFQTGRDADAPGLLRDCWERYLAALKTFDFSQTGESFVHRLSWHIRQAHTDYIVKSVSSLPVSAEERKQSRLEKKKQLYLRQKQLLDTFLEHRAISQAQYDKSLGDLTEKMGFSKTENGTEKEGE